MAVISEDFVRCKICDNADFEKREVVTIPKGVKREDKTVPYPTLQSDIMYFCVRCGLEQVQKGIC